MDKNSFLIYLDYEEQFNLLSNEEAGILIKSIIKYEKEKQIPVLDGMVKMAFSFIKTQLDRDREKYQEKCEKNKENARKRWNAKNANVCDGKIRNTNHADNDNDNDNDNDIKKKNIKRKNPTLEEIQNYIQEKKLKVDGEVFWNYFEVGDWTDSKGNKVKNWKQKLLTWDKYNIKPIFKNINSNKLTNYNNYEQRQYDNLENLYANGGK